MDVTTLKKQIYALKEKRVKINNSLMTYKDRKDELYKIKLELDNLYDELNNITHFREKDVANDLVNKIGDYCSARWDSPKNKFWVYTENRDNYTKICIECVHLEYKQNGDYVNQPKKLILDLITKKDKQIAKERLFNILVECKNNE